MTFPDTSAGAKRFLTVLPSWAHAVSPREACLPKEVGGVPPTCPAALCTGDGAQAQKGTEWPTGPLGVELEKTAFSFYLWKTAVFGKTD